MNTIYRAIKRIMIIAACLPMSIGAVSIALVNNTKQPLTIVPTGKTLAPGQQYGQDIGDGYTSLLRAQNNDVIGVEMNQGISTITIQNAQGLVLYGKKTSGPFAGKWFIEEGDKGSLQLRKISSSAVSIALINNTKQPLTIISTDVTLAQGQLYNQDIDDGYTPLLRAQNNDVIGVERHNNVSTITIEDAQGHVLYGKQISGGFAGKWSIEEGARGSLQLRQIPAFNSAWDVPGSWQLYCRTATLSNNVLTAKCQAFDPLYTGGWWKTTSINLEDRGSVGNADGLFRVASVKGQLVPER